MTTLRFLLLTAALLTSPALTLAASTRVFDCIGTFPSTLERAHLTAQFGEAYVQDAAIHLGDGVYENGTILFADFPEHRVEIFWWDPAAKRHPKTIRVRANRSTWMTLDALAPGMDLRTVERLNGRPFRLAGFHRTPGGTQLSWAGGMLDSIGAGDCSLQVRFSPGPQADPALARQLRGDSDFSSAHPAMHGLNPRLYEMSLQYRMPGSRRALAMP